MKYNFDKIVDRKNTNSYKWDTKKANKENILNMWVADMDFMCEPKIVKAIVERASEGIYGYCFHETDEFYASIIKWLKKRYNTDVKKESIVYTPGVVVALVNIMQALTKENEGVIIQTPVYYPFYEIIKNNNRNVIENPLINNEGYYSINFKELEILTKKKENTMMILCSPHNPVGRVWTKKELEKIIKLCEDNNVILVSDEIHMDLIRKDIKQIPINKLSKNAVACMATSKTFNLPGFNAAYTIVPNENYRKKIHNQIYNVNGLEMPNFFAETSITSAYKNGEEWLEQVIDYVYSNMDYIKEFIEEKLPKIKFLIPEGTYLAWLDFSNYNIEDKELGRLIYEECNIYLDDGNIFGSSGENFQRIVTACPKSYVVECMDRIYKVFKDL